jgi:hypothetical protein
MIGVFAPSKQAASAMTRARDCVVKGGALSVGGAGQARQGAFAYTTLIMTPDGGWCWGNYTRYSGATKIAPPLTLARAPTNGEVQFEQRSEATRVAFRPRPGFYGDDSFVVRDATTNTEREYRVVVQRK